MLVEALVAFAIILGVSLAFYYIASGSRRPKPPTEDPQRSMYSCGEEMKYDKFRISVTFSEYLVYFVVIDSATFLIALSALAADVINPLALVVYLLLVLSAVVLLSRGG